MAVKPVLDLITKIFGKNALLKNIGTRTNVIRLPNASVKRLIRNDLDMSRANESQLKKFRSDAEELIADISKMNDQELLTFKGNLQRYYDVMYPPKADVFDFQTRTQVPKAGIKQLADERGLPEGVDPDSLMGRLLTSANKVKMQAKELEEMTKPMSTDDLYKQTRKAIEEPTEAEKAFRAKEKNRMSDIFEAMTQNPYRPGGPLDPAIGITRTAARSLLEKKGIKIENKDPLDLVRENFGQDVLSDLNNLSEELLEIERRGGSYKDIDKILDNEGFFDLKINKNAPKGLSDEELRKKLKEFEEDPEGLAKGGRVGYAEGSPDQKQMAMVEDMLKRGMDMDTIKTLTGASDEMIQDRINFIKYGGAKVPIKKETRTKQAGGGVAYLMGL